MAGGLLSGADADIGVPTSPVRQEIQRPDSFQKQLPPLNLSALERDAQGDPFPDSNEEGNAVEAAPPTLAVAAASSAPAAPPPRTPAVPHVDTPRLFFGAETGMEAFTMRTRWYGVLFIMLELENRFTCMEQNLLSMLPRIPGVAPPLQKRGSPGSAACPPPQTAKPQARTEFASAGDGHVELRVE